MNFIRASRRLACILAGLAAAFAAVPAALAIPRPQSPVRHQPGRKDRP